MTSPFPGMDPYLEGELWPEVHHDLASKIKKQLVPQIKPKYVARVEKYVVQDDNPNSDIGVMYPDMNVFLNQKTEVSKEDAVIYGSKKQENFITPSTFSIPMTKPIPVRVPVVEIRDRSNNRLVTAIEILSPVNKRKPGLKPYLEKRQKLYDSNVHLLEIDLLRRGARPVSHPKLKNVDYVFSLTRTKSSKIDFWAFSMKHNFPITPVPLLTPDADAILDLKLAIDEIYEESAFELSIDYKSFPPPPKIEKEIWEWMQNLV